MKKKALILTAKIVSILYIIFITIFAFDEKLLSVGFFIHLIPSIFFIAILITAVSRPKIGGVLFIIAGIGTIIFFNTYRDLIAFLTVSIIPMVIGVLFFMQKKNKI